MVAFKNRNKTAAATDNGYCPKRAALMEKVFDGLADTMGYLACRWADEHKFEDIADYQAHIEQAIKRMKVRGITITKMTKRPFGFECEVLNGRYRVSLAGSNYSYKRIG